MLPSLIAKKDGEDTKGVSKGKVFWFLTNPRQGRGREEKLRKKTENPPKVGGQKEKTCLTSLAGT